MRSLRRRSEADPGRIRRVVVPKRATWSGVRRVRLVLALVVAGLAAAGGLSGVVALAVTGPLPAPPEALLAADATRFEDRHGALLYAPAATGLRRTAALAEIAPSLRAAVIATEDAAFYAHPGVNPLAVLRAAVANLRAGRTVSGAGTIPQQLVRNLYMGVAPSVDPAGGVPAPAGDRGVSAYGRKAREAVLALRLSRVRDKDAVLALYLNHAYFGNLAYGAEAAARVYFDRPARDLDLAESAMLAGLIQAPAAYDPLRFPDAARARQAEVLERMVATGAAPREEAEVAREERLAFARSPYPIEAPHFVAWVREQVEAALGPGAAHGGLRVVTALDLGVQRTAEATVRRRLAALADKDVSNAAVVALDPATGQVLALVGSADYFDPRIDGAVNLALAARQPGSALKPLLYALALEGEVTAATPLLDVRTTFTTRAGEPYAPNNYDGRFHGPIPVREALAGSYNVPAVRLLSQVSVGRFLALAAAAGITTLAEHERLDLSVILGGGETPLLELTGAYGALANGGVRRPPIAVLRIEDGRGRTVWQPPAQAPTRVFSPEAAWLVTDILADNEARTPAFGAASPLRVNRPAAAKTGTTTDFRDNLTVGYTPDLVVGVWVGNADNRPMRDVSGITGAAPIWHDVIEDALTGRPPRPFARPADLTRAEVCLPSGMRPTPHCARRRLEWFRAGTEPAADDTYYRAFPVCLATGRIATGPCPGGQVVERVYEFPPDEALPWARTAGVALAPFAGEAAGLAVGDGRPAVRFVRPQPGLTVRLTRSLPDSVQQVTIELESDGAPPERVRVELDGAVLAEWPAPPYRLTWPPAVGSHRLRAVALRGAAEVVSDELELTVLPP